MKLDNIRKLREVENTIDGVEKSSGMICIAHVKVEGGWFIAYISSRKTEFRFSHYTGRPGRPKLSVVCDKDLPSLKERDDWELVCSYGG